MRTMIKIMRRGSFSVGIEFFIAEKWCIYLFSVQQPHPHFIIELTLYSIYNMRNSYADDTNSTDNQNRHDEPNFAMNHFPCEAGATNTYFRACLFLQ